MRLGVTSYFPVQVYDVKVEQDALTVYGVTKPVHSRVDTISNPLLTVRFSSPMPNVIRVQIRHHGGQRQPKPFFQFNIEPSKVEISENEHAATLTSGNLTVRVEKRNWLISFKDGSSNRREYSCRHNCLQFQHPHSTYLLFDRFSQNS